MASAIMMYVLPMMLGQTYDLGKEKPGLQIYPATVEEKSFKIEHYFTDSQYRMVENAGEIRDFLDVSGKLSLKIKSGVLDIGGEGSYLKDSSSKSNGIEILVKVHFETVTKTIPTSLKPNVGWSLMNKKYLGTHYCRSITYGGDLVASIRISSSNRYDLERIKGAINGGVKTKGGSFTMDVKGKLEKLKNDAQDSSSMEINYYASVPIHGVSYDIDGLMKLIDDFPNQVKKVNDGLGNPLRMELYPLSSLQEDLPLYYENRALADELEDLEEQFDDLRETKQNLGVWMSDLPPVIPTNVQKKIETFIEKINKIFGVYLKTIANLDIAEGASTQPIQDAFNSYKDGEYIVPQKYIRKFRQLQNEIYEEAPELKPRIGGAEYIRWGKSQCDSADSETSLSGVTSASDIAQSGGSSEFLCSPSSPDNVNPSDYFKNYDPRDAKYNHLLVSPIRYRGDLQRFKSMKNKPFACARCRVSQRTAVLMKAAVTSCPNDNWVKEYEGILMAPGINSVKGEFICVDKEMQDPAGRITFGSSVESRLSEVQEVTVACGSLPCEPYEVSQAIPCVVCTI